MGVGVGGQVLLLLGVVEAPGSLSQPVTSARTPEPAWAVQEGRSVLCLATPHGCTLEETFPIIFRRHKRVF